MSKILLAVPIAVMIGAISDGSAVAVSNKWEQAIDRLTRERDGLQRAWEAATEASREHYNSYKKAERERDDANELCESFKSMYHKAARERDELAARCEQYLSAYVQHGNLLAEIASREADLNNADQHMDEIRKSLAQERQAVEQFRRERDEARRALHEIVTNGAWVGGDWCVFEAVYDLAYEADLRAISTGEKHG